MFQYLMDVGKNVTPYDPAAFVMLCLFVPAVLFLGLSIYRQTR